MLPVKHGVPWADALDACGEFLDSIAWQYSLSGLVCLVSIYRSNDLVGRKLEVSICNVYKEVPCRQCNWGNNQLIYSADTLRRHT